MFNFRKVSASFFYFSVVYVWQRGHIKCNIVSTKMNHFESGSLSNFSVFLCSFIPVCKSFQFPFCGCFNQSNLNKALSTTKNPFTVWLILHGVHTIPASVQNKKAIIFPSGETTIEQNTHTKINILPLRKISCKSPKRRCSMLDLWNEETYFKLLFSFCTGCEV